MNIINLNHKRLTRLILLFFFYIYTFLLSQCHELGTSPFTLSNVELCDNFNQKADCIEPKPDKGTVILKHTLTGKEVESWDDFSNYLYFTARETPGFVLTFTRDLNPEERKLILDKYAAYLEIDGVREKMEGFQLGANKVASFHYLGAILKQVKRSQHKEKDTVDLEKSGSLLLHFEYILPNQIKGSLTREIDLKWK